MTYSGSTSSSDNSSTSIKSRTSNLVHFQVFSNSKNNLKTKLESMRLFLQLGWI